MCNSEDGRTIEVAFNEIDEVKYHKTFHKDRKITNHELKLTWNRVLKDVNSISQWLRKCGVTSFFYPV